MFDYYDLLNLAGRYAQYMELAETRTKRQYARVLYHQTMIRIADFRKSMEG